MTRRRLTLLALLAAAATATAALLGLACAWTWDTGVGSVASQSEAEAHAGSLRVVLGARPTRPHDIGEVARGGRVEVPFVVSNPGSAAVTVGPIQTSCDCLRVELDVTRVEPGTEVGGRAVIDLAKEPGFAGGLMLDAEATAAEDGRPVFDLRLSVQVR
jgi:hypothetical protein